MKQALTETLAYFDENDQAFRMSDLRIYVAAARLVERLLPGVCPHGKFEPHTFPLQGHPDVSDYCPAIGVWDEGIVEAVAGAIEKHYAPQWLDPVELADMARAVLSALVELLTEKEERLVVTLHNDTQVADRPVLESIEGVDPSEYSIELSTQPSRLPE